MATIDSVAPPPRARWRELRVTRRRALVPGVPVALLLLCFLIPAIIPGLLAPDDPYAPDLAHPYLPPAFAHGGDWSHVLGTDSLGRDTLTRLIFGARASAIIAVTTIMISTIVGTAVGIVAGYFGGWVDAVLMRLTDIVFSLPLIMVAIAAVALLGPSYSVLIGVIVLVLWAQFARLIRGDVLSIRERDYVRYAQTTGVGSIRIMATHILPNVLNSVIVLATVQVGWVILVDSSLSFIGAGVPPPDPAWGAMVADGRDVIQSAWWVSFIPGVAILIVVMSLNTLGDWLRDRLDPRFVTIGPVQKP